MPAYWRSEALCLRVDEFSNTSLIVRCLTRDRGRVALLAKGARRRGSAFFGELEPLRRLDLVAIARKRSPLHTLVEARVTSTYRPLRHDLHRLHAGLYAVELLSEITVDEAPEPALFDLACRALERVAANRTLSPLTVPIFALRALAAVGLGPRLDGCAECGRAVDGDADVGAGAGGPGAGPAWAPILGGVACAGCASGDRDRRPLGADVLRALRVLATADARVPRLAPAVVRDVYALLDAYVAARLERRLRLAPYVAAEVATLG